MPRSRAAYEYLPSITDSLPCHTTKNVPIRRATLKEQRLSIDATANPSRFGSRQSANIGENRVWGNDCSGP